MSMLWYNLALFLAALAGFLYGAVRFFRGKKALYLQMIVCGLGCMMLSRLFQVVMILNLGALRQGFHVGYLGYSGMFLFFFSANYGQMDSLVDDGSAALRPYRRKALYAPAAVLLIYLPIALSGASLSMKISCALIAALAAAAAYYHMKHLIIPDVDYGIIRSIRGYNRFALLIGLLSMTELATLALDMRGALIPLGAALGVDYLLLLPILERGVKQWTT